MGYTQADIIRMENKLEALYEELRSRPDRADLIESEIDNLKYEIEDAKRNMR